MIYLSFFSILYANQIIQAPFFYKASNPSLSPHHIYGFGAYHESLNLDVFQPELWNLLSSFPIAMTEIADVAELLPDKTKFLKPFGLCLIRKMFEHPENLDYKIINFMKSKGVKLVSLDTRKATWKMAIEVHSLIPKSIKNEFLSRRLEILENNSLSRLEKKTAISVLKKTMDEEEENLIKTRRLFYKKGMSEALYILTAITNNFDATITDDGVGTYFEFKTPHPSYEEFFQYLRENILKLRNQNWIPKILATLQESDHSLPIFAGVGHFLEEDHDSLFHLLTAEGFKVERLSNEEIIQELKNIQNK